MTQTASEAARSCIVAICAIEPPDAEKSAALIEALLLSRETAERERAAVQARALLVDMEKARTLCAKRHPGGVVVGACKVCCALQAWAMRDDPLIAAAIRSFPPLGGEVGKDSQGRAPR